MTAEFTLAVHALVYLLHKGSVISSRELSENICTNPARVRKVMAKLHRAGLVEARHGQGSGYITKPENDRLSLDRVIDAIGENPVSMNWRSGDIDMQCLIASGMGDIMKDIYSSMNDSCRATLASVTIGDINSMIFDKERKEK